MKLEVGYVEDQVQSGQAARDLDLHGNMLRRWAKEMASNPAEAFPGHGQIKAEHLED